MMLLSPFGFTNFGISDSVSILIVTNTHFLFLFLRCKTLSLRLELLLMLMLLLLYFLNVLECGTTRSLQEKTFLGSKEKYMNMCFYVQHFTNVLYILVCYIFMPSKFLTVINKTLKTR